MRAFGDQMEIEIGEDAAVAVRIVDLDDVIAGIDDPQPVVGERLARDSGERPALGIVSRRDVLKWAASRVPLEGAATAPTSRA